MLNTVHQLWRDKIDIDQGGGGKGNKKGLVKIFLKIE